MSDVDLRAKTATCSECGPVTVYRSGNGVRCSTTRIAQAKEAYRRGRGRSSRRQLAAARGCCDQCGFVAADPCQLDVDHVDGDWTRDEDNWQVLCANCHRLKTYRPEKWAANRLETNKKCRTPRRPKAAGGSAL